MRGQVREDRGPRRPRRSVCKRLLEQGDRATAVACFAEPVGAVEDAPAHVVDIVGRRQPDGQLGQLGCGSGCASCVHALCRLLDDGGDLAARLGSAASARCRARSSVLGATWASRAWSDRRCAGVARDQTAERSRGCVKRSRSPSTSRIRASIASPSPVSAGRPAAASTRRTVGSASAATTRATSSPWSPEAIDALVHELFQIRGDWQLLARIHPAAPSLQRARELEGEERISRRRLPDAQERRSGKDGAEARSQQLVQRADAERAELDAAEPLIGQVPLQPERHLVASGQDRGDRLHVEAGQSEPKHRKRRCVEPLDVVDREQQLVVDGERPQGAQESECNNALLGGCAVEFRERKRGFERPPLRPWQLRQHVGDDVSDQVGQPGERERRFRLGRAAGEHQVSTRLRRPDGCEPQRGLADPGLADDHGSRGQLIGRVEEIEESGELVLPARKVRNADCHAFLSTATG